MKLQPQVIGFVSIIMLLLMSMKIVAHTTCKKRTVNSWPIHAAYYRK